MNKMTAFLAMGAVAAAAYVTQAPDAPTVQASNPTTTMQIQEGSQAAGVSQKVEDVASRIAKTRQNYSNDNPAKRIHYTGTPG